MSGKSQYKNLIIIGNGFDRWQGLPTSYDEFRKYYHKNIKRITHDMGIKPLPSGLTPVELVYGNALKPTAFPDKFFWNLETSMSKIDDQLLISAFDKSRKGLYQLQKTSDSAKRILQNTFAE